MDLIVVLLITALILFFAWCAWNYLPAPFGVIVGGILLICALIYFVSNLDVSDGEEIGLAAPLLWRLTR